MADGDVPDDATRGRLTEDHVQEGLFGVTRGREQLGEAEIFESRTPCPSCGTSDAYLLKRGNQNTVRCLHCRRHLYNAPKSETGERPRTVTTVRQHIKPGQQARIFDRDNGRCVLCGRSDQSLTIGHLLSIHQGLELGATEDLLNSDANLAAMCEACNLGLGRRSVLPTTYARVLLHLVEAASRANGASTSGDSPAALVATSSEPAPAG